MNKKNLVMVLSLLVIVVGVGLIIYSLKTAQTKKTTTTTTTTHTMPPASPASSMSHEGMDMTGSAAQAQPQAVVIKNFAFSPATLTVKKGTTVSWTNQDAVRHSVIAKTASGPKSGLLGQNESYSFTFNTAGTFSYNCGPHPQMQATITVTE